MHFAQNHLHLPKSWNISIEKVKDISKLAVKIMRFLPPLRHLRLCETLSGTNALWSHEGRWFDGCEGMRLPCSLPIYIPVWSFHHECMFFVIMTCDMEVEVHYHQFIHGGPLVIWKSISWIKSVFVLPEGWQISCEITLLDHKTLVVLLCREYRPQSSQPLILTMIPKRWSI